MDEIRITFTSWILFGLIQFLFGFIVGRYTMRRLLDKHIAEIQKISQEVIAKHYEIRDQTRKDIEKMSEEFMKGIDRG